jgi:heme-degrading monooxygenase HmoA
MVARVTLAEVDTVRMSVAHAVELFETSVLPELREAPGYEGGYVFVTPEGKALVIGFWEDEPAAAASVASGLYAAQVEKFLTLVRSSPGRETYDVVHADPPRVPAAV